MKKIVAFLVALLVAVGSVSVAVAGSCSYGDANGNGQIDIFDVTTIQRYIAKIITIDDDLLDAVDVDGDGEIGIMDCTSVQCYLAKVIEHFPVEDKITPTETPTEAPTEAPTQAPVDDTKPNEMELEILRLVNVERAKEGLKPLKFDYDRYECAKIRAKECNKEVTFSHTRPDGRPWYTVMDDMGKGSYWQAGENLALYMYSAEHVVQGWMNSPGHRANILRPEYDLMAVAVWETEEYPGYYSAAQLFIATWDNYRK